MRIVDKIWKYSGVNFYFKWLLPTNPNSRFFLWRLLWINPYNNSFYISGNSKKYLIIRMLLAAGFFSIHSAGFIVFLTGYNFSNNWYSSWEGNILVNIYPCLVQIMIVERLFRVLRHRKQQIRF